MRVGLVFSGLLALAVGVALYFGQLQASLPALVARLWPAAAAPAAAPRSAVPVVVAKAEAGEVPVYLTGIGTVQAYNTVSVKTRVDGEITQVLFQEGQDVKAGDPLVIVDPRPYAAQLQQQEAARLKDQALLEAATLDLRRYETLVQKEFASRQSVDQQRAQVDQYRAQIKSDEAQIDYARTQLGYTRIIAPIGGRAGIRQIDQGNFLHAGDNATIVVITQLQPISVIFTLSASAVGRTRLAPGQAHAPVTALAEDDTTELDRGTVDIIDNQVDQTTGTIKLKASFPNAALRLWPGNFVNGRIEVETRKAAVTIPAAAARHGPRGDFAWVIKPDHTAEARPVTLGQVFAGRALIERGLAAGESVVTEGSYRLENGSAVEIVTPEPPAAGAAAARPAPAAPR